MARTLEEIQSEIDELERQLQDFGALDEEPEPEAAVTVEESSDEGIASMLVPEDDDYTITTKAKGAGLLASQIGTILTDHIPATIGRMIRGGDDTLADIGALDNWITMNQEEGKASKILTDEQREKVWMDVPVFGAITFGDIEDSAESFGYSIANGAATGGGALAAAQAGAAAGVPAGPVGTAIGALGGLIAGSTVSTRASKDAFIDDVKERFIAANGGQVTDELQKKWEKVYDEIQDDATLYGFWEAAPETVGNMLTFGIMKGGGKLAAPMLNGIKSDIARKVGTGAMKMAAMYGEESATEVVTAMKQSEIEARRGLRDKPLNLGEAWDEVKAQVGLMSTVFGGFGAVLSRSGIESHNTKPMDSEDTKTAQQNLDTAKASGTPQEVQEMQDILNSSREADLANAEAQVLQLQERGVTIDEGSVAQVEAEQAKVEGIPSEPLTGLVTDADMVAAFEATLMDAPPTREAAREIEAKPEKTNKELVMDNFQKQKKRLETDINNMDAQERVYGIPAEEKPAFTKKRKKLGEELGAINYQIKNAEEYGHLVPEDQAWRLVGLEPLQMQKKIVEDMGMTEKSFAKRVEDERKRNERKQEENRKNLFKAQRKDLQRRKRNKALREAENRIVDQQINQQIAEMEAAEEAAITADITLEEAAPRTRAPFQRREPAQIPTIEEAIEETARTPFRRTTPTEVAVGEAIEEPVAPVVRERRAVPRAEVEESLQRGKKTPFTPRKLTQEERFKSRSKEGTILASSNTPYKTEESAQRAIRKIGKLAPFEYKVVEVDGGFGIREKTKKEIAGPRYFAPSGVKFSIPKNKIQSDTQLKKVKKEVRKFAKNLDRWQTGDTKVVVLRKPSDLKNIPEAADTWEEMKARGLHHARGAAADNTVYFFSDNIDTSEMPLHRLFLHEFRHISLSELMGNRWKNLLTQYTNQHEGRIQKRIKDMGLPINNDTMFEYAEEDFIEQYMDGAKAGIIEDMIALVKRFLRDIIGLDIDVSDAEVRSFLSMVDRNIKDKTKAQRSVMKKPRYSANIPVLEESEVEGYYGVEGPLNEVSAAKRMIVGPTKQTEFTKLREYSYAKFVSKTAPVKWKQNQYEAKTGKRTEAYEKTRIISSLGSVADAVMHSGMPEAVEGIGGSMWVGVKKGGEYGGLITELKKTLGTNSVAFFRGLQAERILEEMQRNPGQKRKWFGKKVDDAAMINTLLRDSEKIRKKVGEAKWKRANDVVQAYTKRKLDLAQQSGLINAEERASWERNIYVPLAREIEKTYDKMNADRKSNMVIGDLIKSGIKQLEESADAKLGDPLENYISNFNFMLNETMRNVARRDTVSMLLELNDGSIQEVKKRGSATNPNVIGVFVGGKERFFKINDDLVFDALVDIPSAYTQNPLWKAFITRPKQWITGAITNSPAFMLANFIRDAVSSVVLSGKLKPHDPLVGLYKTLTNHPDFVEMKSMGGAFTGYDLVSKAGTKGFARELHGYKGVLGHSWDVWRDFGTRIENAVRVQEFARAKQKGAKPAGAAFASRDVMDFADKGSAPLINLVVSMVPFMNARIRGLDKLGRSYKQERIKFMTRGALLSAAAVMIHAGNEDRDDYKDLPDWDKFANLHFFVGDDHFKIPNPFEIGALFVSLPIAMYDIAKTDIGGKHIINWAKQTLSDTLAFNPIPQTIKPVVEQLRNKRFFTGAPVIPASQLRVDPEYQYGPYTSQVTKALGKLGLSPRRFEHLVGGYFGTLGQMALAGADTLMISMGLANERPSDVDRVMNVLGKRRFYSRKLTTSRYQDIFREEMPKIMQVANTYRKLQLAGEYEKALSYFEKNQKTIAQAPYYKSVQMRIRANNKYALKIANDKLMSLEKRQEKLDELTDRNLAIYKQAVKRFKLEGRID